MLGLWLNVSGRLGSASTEPLHLVLETDENAALEVIGVADVRN